MKKTAILGIDLQNDFTRESGSLYVTGASKDIDRILSFIERGQGKIDYIALTLDSHQPIHIAHQSYWKNAKGEHPQAMTNISYQDVKDGVWNAQFNKSKALDYLKQLETKGGRCTIWPLHCVLGTKGWAVNEKLMNVLIDWAVNNDRSYEIYYKGYAQNTEHYSIFRAAVEYPDQAETCLNSSLLDSLDEFEELIIVGEAADFCVASSLNDILEEKSSMAHKLVLFTDCMSWIIENNNSAVQIFDKAAKMRVRFMKSTDYSF